AELLDLLPVFRTAPRWSFPVRDRPRRRRETMKRSRFSEAQIAFVLRQAEEGTAVGEVCRKAGISEATFCNWRKRYGGMMPSEVRRLRQPEEENGKLKKLVAELSLDKARKASSSRATSTSGPASDNARLLPPRQADGQRLHREPERQVPGGV